MVSIYFVLGIVAVLGSVTSTETTPGYFSVQVITDPNKFHPVDSGEKLIEVTSEPRAARTPIYYHLGHMRPGDKLLSQSSSTIVYKEPRDIEVTLQYPKHGKGETVSFVDITVNQSSIIGRADVISGGIGQKHIAIRLVSKQTMYIDYTARVYGAGSRIIGNQFLFIGLVGSLIFKYGIDSSLFGIF